MIATSLPTVTSDGLALTELISGHASRVPCTETFPFVLGAWHATTSETETVSFAVTVKGPADPAHVSPASDVPAIEIVYPEPAASPLRIAETVLLLLTSIVPDFAVGPPPMV